MIQIQHIPPPPEAPEAPEAAPEIPPLLEVPTSALLSLNWMRIFCIILIVGSLGLTGCSPYQLQGRVVMGRQSTVMAVTPKDSRLMASPIENATVELTLDPSSISPKQLGQVVTDSQGNFVLDIDAMGAGSFQEYDLGILVTAKNHTNVWQTIRLPSPKKKLLVIMARGHAGPKPPKDILKESLKFKDRFMGQ